jgi:AAA15 family ATPase/GTPase
MLIEFTVGNFLSFNEKRTLNFEAKGISELKQNVMEKRKLLRSVVVYGANSSGKSNLIKALDRMRDCVLLSVKLNDSDNLDYSPFLLSEEGTKNPTFFEVVFWDKEQRFRYGFEYNETAIVNEWLFTGKSAKTEKALFIRKEDGIGVSEHFKEGRGKEEATNDNRLFLSLSAQLGGTISKLLMQWFENYNVLSGIEHKDYEGYSKRMFHENLNGCNESLSLFQTLQLGFKGVKTTESDFNPDTDLPDDISIGVKSQLLKKLSGRKKVSFQTIHSKYNTTGEIINSISWDKDENESEGTKKIMDLSGPIFDTLLSGKILIVDELDAKLHPLITIRIVKLFNNPATNPNNAQLLFATHDTSLLSNDLFRRDQIWFTEKDEMEQTDLYSLSDFVLPDGTKARNDANLEKNYIRGRYGAIPFITK